MKRSELQLPCTRARHVAVTWKEATIIWGGYSSNETVTNSQVDVHLSGKWTREDTRGDVPSIDRSHTGCVAHVVDDIMFVLSTSYYFANTVDLYSLDLNNWIWAKLVPNGTQPMGLGHWHFSSWVHNKKIFIFGGEIQNQGFLNVRQLICYNIASNSWEWPNQKGDIPWVHSMHSTVINGNDLYLFGGLRFRPSAAAKYINDLYILDMISMRWTQVHGDLSDSKVPSGKLNDCNGTVLTRISQHKAVLLGTNRIGENECWLLNLANAKQHMDASSIWTRMPNYSRRFGATVCEPVSRSLWVIGGFVDTYGPYGPEARTYLRVSRMTSEVLIMPLNPSLKDMAVATAARNHCLKDARLAPDGLATNLRDEIEEYRREIGGKYVCSEQERCSRCKPASPAMNKDPTNAYCNII